ncbi:MAG TPA: hypothetical protein VE779_18055 [Candidatus Angelobacter sp.]|nr:hypothetical protein [Candidatus Angelobacter sp.]
MLLERFSTYFLFPFALDREAIQEDHPQAWPGKTRWIDGLDSWIAGESGRSASKGVSRLGVWKRSTYSRFDIDSPAYADLLFFNSIVRHVFFDTNIGRSSDDQENQLRCYTIGLNPAAKLWFAGTDALGGSGRAQVTDLRLYLSAQGTGILSIGVEAETMDSAQALWINRRLRKLYPVDASSISEGRTPNWLGLRLEEAATTETICEERFDDLKLVGFYPPLPATVKSLLYFADYTQEEYEPVLDENMLVYSYGELTSGGGSTVNLGADAATVEEFLYLRHSHAGAVRYSSPRGDSAVAFTGHSCAMLGFNFSAPLTDDQWRTICGQSDGVVWVEKDARAIFHSRLYLIMIVACFYRAVLRDFSERSALVSRRLQTDQQAGRLSLASIQMVNDFRTEFLNFSGYWHFDELSTKHSGNDLFRRLCAEYRIDDVKEVLATELRHMTEFVYNFYQLRTTEAVNRLALLSLLFGGGAVLTGFFGMNFGREFGHIFFEGEGFGSVVHYFFVVLVITFVFGSLCVGTFVVLRNWREYLAFLSPPKSPSRPSSIKRTTQP